MQKTRGKNEKKIETNIKIVDLSSITMVITLNVNSLTSLIKKAVIILVKNKSKAKCICS